VIKFCLIAAILFILSIGAMTAQEDFSSELISKANIEQIQEISLLNGAGPVWFLSWSPSGDRLAVIRGASAQTVEIWKFRADTFSFHLASTFHPLVVDRVEWLPDNRHIVTNGQLNEESFIHYYTAIWESDTGSLTSTLMNAREPKPQAVCCEISVPPIIGWNSVYTLSAAVENQSILQFSDGNHFLFRFPESFFSDRFTEVPEGGTIAGVFWSPSDTYLAVHFATVDTYKLQLVDASHLKPIGFIYGPDYWICEVAWSPNETTLAVASQWSSVSEDSTGIAFYQVGIPVFYGQEISLWDPSIEYGHPCKAAIAWSPDSSLIAIGSPSEIHLLETKTYNELNSLRSNPVLALSWHPSGQIIASGNNKGIVQFWAIQQ
jgi:WD40 repeat protein